LKEMKLAEALAGIEETLYYYAFPREHWRCLRTNTVRARLHEEHLTELLEVTGGRHPSYNDYLLVYIQKRFRFFSVSESVTHIMHKTSETRWAHVVGTATEVFLNKGHKRAKWPMSRRPWGCRRARSIVT
jgi:hypothetical protein